jgi:hypothetical protein
MQKILGAFMLVLSLSACAATTPAPTPTSVQVPTAPTPRATAPSPSSPPANGQTLRINPQPLKPGVRATFLATGFQSGELVDFTLVTPSGGNIEVGAGQADGGGNVFRVFDVPRNLDPGQYIAFATSESDESRSAQVNLSVEAKK